MAWVAAVAVAGCGGSSTLDVDSTTPVGVEDDRPETDDVPGVGDDGPDPGDADDSGDEGSGGSDNSGSGDGNVEAAAPRCADLSAQGLLCHDSWCWELEGQQGNSLSASASSGTEVWAVGAVGTLLHWDGTRWSREESGTRVALTDVDEAGGEVWAVGGGGVILRRTAGRWSAVTGPDSGLGSGDISQVEVSAPGNVWIATAGGVARHHEGTWSWMVRGEGRYDVWSSGPDDVWILGEKTGHHWDGAALREVEAPFVGGRLGGSERGRPYVAVANALYQWNGSAFEERFAIANDSFSIDFLAQRGGDLWVFASRGGVGTGVDEGRMLLRWDGKEARVAWSEMFLTTSLHAAGMPRSLALLDGGGAFLLGDAGRTLHWDGASWSAPPRIPGTVAELLPLDTGELWALTWSRGPSLGGLRWDGTAWRQVAVGGFDSGRLTGTAPDDVWVLSGRPQHWDGSAWTGYDAGFFTDLRSVSRDDVWAVGLGGRAARWRGTGWSEVSTGTTGDLQVLWSSGTDDVWAGGATLIHWDGAAWAPAPGLDAAEDLRITSLSGSGSGPADVWAAGARLHHWDGAAWKDVAAPPGRERCWKVWSASPDATYLTCGTAFFHRVGDGWRELPFQSAPDTFAGTAARGYAASGDAVLRFCRE